MKKKLILFSLLLVILLSGCGEAGFYFNVINKLDTVPQKKQLHDYDGSDRVCQGKISNFLKNLYIHCTKGIEGLQQYEI